MGLATGLIAACAAVPETDDLRLRWPEPPDVTRIEHVQTIYDGRQFASPGFWERALEVLLGPGQRYRPIGLPSDLVLSPDGTTLYVSDFSLGLIHVFDVAARRVRYLPDDAPLDRPFGLAIDSTGSLWVAEQAKRRIRVIGPDGETRKLIRSDALVRPTDIALDEKRGRLYVADPSRQQRRDHHIQIFDLDGHHVGTIGLGRGSRPGHLLFPTYLTLDAEGRLFVSDTMNARVSVFEPDGTFVRTIGQRGDGFGQFDKPKGVAFDSFGNLYVVDSSWSNIQIFGPKDDALLFFGARGGFPGLLRNPTGIAIEPRSNTIFVGDYLNHRVSVYRLINTAPGDGLAESTSREGTQP